VTALLERERELAELEAVVGEARCGTGRLVAIEAKAGLGKTRLLQVAREAGTSAGLNVLAGRATELELRQARHPLATAARWRARRVIARQG
jgi:hypothetical protein